ncbi:MAG: hypothetical protein ACXIUB_10405 [Wenzhouxiangella sp.]
MNHQTPKSIALALTLAASILSSAALAQNRAGPVDESPGELLATHTCTTHGYVLRVYRPAGHDGGLNPDGSPATAPSSERVIQVEPMAKQFHATWNEVSNLIDNHPPHMLNHQALPANPGANGQRFCNRTGHLIPIDLTVYQVNLQHHNNYNGSTSVFANNNAETAPLTILIQKYNQLRDQGDALPNACPMGCLDLGDGVIPDTPWGGGPGTYTTADGEVHEWELLDPADGPGTGVGGSDRPDLGHAEAERERSVGQPVTRPERAPAPIQRQPREATPRRRNEPPQPD